MRRINGLGDGRYEVQEGGRGWFGSLPDRKQRKVYNWQGLQNYLESMTGDEDFILGEGLTLDETNKLVKIIVK